MTKQKKNKVQTKAKADILASTIDAMGLKPMSPPPSEIQLTDDMIQLGARIPRSLLGALDIEIMLLMEQCPSVVFTRTDALRSILTKVIQDPANVARVHERRNLVAEEERRALKRLDDQRTMANADTRENRRSRKR